MGTVETNGMDCAAKKLELELMRDHTVHIVLRCGTGYEASVLFEEISDALKTGQIRLTFGTTKTTVFDNT